MADPDSDRTALRRRRFVQTLAGAGGFSVLAGCNGGGGGGGDGDGGAGTETGAAGNDTGGDGGSGELEVMHWWTAGGEEDAINALYEGFREEYPDVQINDNPAPGGAGSALDTQIRNRVVNENPPSTFQVWPGEALQPFYESDVLESIGGVWTDEMQNAYLEGVRDAAQPQGEFVAVPINIHRLNNVFYNVSVVEDAGVDPGSIDSLDAFTNAVETVDSETDAVGIAQSTQANWTILQFFEMVLLSDIGAEGQQAFMDGNVSEYESQVRNALQYTADVREYYNEDASSVAWDEANQDVISGDAAFLHNGDWAAGQYSSAEDFAYGEDWDYIPFPGTADVYSVVMDSFVYPSNNPSPEATEAWLTYCGTPDAQIRFNREKGAIPPRTDIDASEFDEFLGSQMEAFDASEAQPPTIAHGSGVTPTQKSNVEGTFANFIENWNVDAAYQGLVDAF